MWEMMSRDQTMNPHIAYLYRYDSNTVPLRSPGRLFTGLFCERSLTLRLCKLRYCLFGKWGVSCVLNSTNNIVVLKTCREVMTYIKTFLTTGLKNISLFALNWDHCLCDWLGSYFSCWSSGVVSTPALTPCTISCCGSWNSSSAAEEVKMWIFVLFSYNSFLTTLFLQFPKWGNIDFEYKYEPNWLSYIF